MTLRFKVGDKVKDKDGFEAVITQTTYWGKSQWYTVRIIDGTRVVGEAVRYESDLEPRGNQCCA